MKTYVPIDCDQYDFLESLATQKMNCDISYRLADEIRNTHSIIKTLITIRKEEFIQLENGTEIRLDNIISINGKTFIGIC